VFPELPASPTINIRILLFIKIFIQALTYKRINKKQLYALPWQQSSAGTEHLPSLLTEVTASMAFFVQCGVTAILTGGQESVGFEM
jgi:hypothetical protein